MAERERPPRRDPGRSPGRALVAALLVAAPLVVAAACQVPRSQLLPPDRVAEAGGEGHLKVHLLSGDVLLMTTWREDAEARRITGLGTRYDPHRVALGGPRPVDLPVDSVALLEVHRATPDVARGMGFTLLASYTVLTGAVSFICLMDPKSCFGSCPTFYVDGYVDGYADGYADGYGDGDVVKHADAGPDAGEEPEDRPVGWTLERPLERLVAEGFSSSVARALEATDMDDLRIRVGPGPFSIRMRNEALETHAVRSLRLHAVLEPDGERALATPEGTFRLARRLHEPARCRAPEGDCLPLVRAKDGAERKSLSDPDDLARREVVELAFRLPAPDPAANPQRPGAGGEPSRFGLVLSARHSFVSTFLFYQMLGYLGRDAAPLLAGMERGDAALVARVRELLDLPGRIEVSWQGEDGTWHPAGAYVEAGPLASDVQLLELPGVPAEGELRVRLDLTQGFWRLEYAALAELGEIPASVALLPVEVNAVGPGDPGKAMETPAPAALATLLDPDRHLVTDPGDHYRIRFDLPDAAAGVGFDAVSLGYRLFLESTGYYYEWMRAEWMADESPERAAAMFLDPARAFRELAPAFKRLEPEMEAAFWSSRFRR